MGACKKGENDPFLSLKSRNARIVGEWELVSSQANRLQTFFFEGITTTTETSTVFENGQEIITGEQTDTNYYELSLTLNKDGSMNVLTKSAEETTGESGYWYWSNDSKKKSGIVFFENDFHIDRLTDEELILHSNIETSKKYEDGSENFYKNSSVAVLSKK